MIYPTGAAGFPPQSPKDKTMQLDIQQTAEFLDNACALEAPIHDGHQAITFGIDDRGREFVLINSAITGMTDVFEI